MKQLLDCEMEVEVEGPREVPEVRIGSRLESEQIVKAVFRSVERSLNGLSGHDVAEGGLFSSMHSASRIWAGGEVVCCFAGGTEHNPRGDG